MIINKVLLLTIEYYKDILYVETYTYSYNRYYINLHISLIKL